MATPTFVAAGTADLANTIVQPVATTLAPPWPAHLVGDIAILFVHTANEEVTFFAKNGFAKMPSSGEGVGAAGGAASTRLTTYWCRANSTSMRAPRIFCPPLDHVAAVILTFRGCPTIGNPWHQTNGDDATSSTSVTIAHSATVIDECLIVAAVGFLPLGTSGNVSAWANANLTSVTERFDQGSLVGNDAAFGIATGIKAVAGTVGSTTATLSAASVQARFGVALKPATAAGPVDLYNFLVLQDPDNADLEMTLKVSSFQEGAKQWSGGALERAFAGNFLDSRRSAKRSFQATVDFHDPTTLTAFEDFIDLGPDTITGQALGPRPLYVRSDPFGAIRLESFVEVLVEIESLTPIQTMGGGWTADLTLQEV